MHLAQRAYVLILLTTVLAIAGIWSSEPGLGGLWRFPAILLLAGLTAEGLLVRQAAVDATVESAGRAFLGREQAAAFVFRNRGARPLTVEYAPAMPFGIEPVPEVGKDRFADVAVQHVPEADEGGASARITGVVPMAQSTRKVVVPARRSVRDALTVLPIRLGLQVWPVIPARLLGALGLAWWSKDFHPSWQTVVAPDILRSVRGRPRGTLAGTRSRRVIGAGAEVHQLRGYVHGDPLARIDWKATARARTLVTRELNEDQHLDVLVAIDAGRLSRVRAGKLDRLGLYANIASRFAEIVVPNDDRIGLLVFADRPLVLCPPDRGLQAVTRLRRALEELSVQGAESDPLGAAVRIRAMLKHRSLVVLLTDLDDVSGTEQLAKAVRLLSPPHFVVIAGVHNREVAQLARQEARNWDDPWIALAAQEHESRVQARRFSLRRLGAPVVAVREELLEAAVLAEYGRLRRARRV